MSATYIGDNLRKMYGFLIIKDEWAMYHPFIGYHIALFYLLFFKILNSIQFKGFIYIIIFLPTMTLLLLLPKSEEAANYLSILVS